MDPTDPAEWDWTPHAKPVGRFDPLSGRFRVRYAANLPAVAVRERFPGRNITEAEGDLWLLGLSPFPPGLRLTRQSTLDALSLDDRVSTGRIEVRRRSDPDPLLETCGALADAVFDWWKGHPPPLVYRSRTMPTVGRSIAFGEWASAPVVARGRLREAIALHAHLVLRAGFTVPGSWLS